MRQLATDRCAVTFNTQASALNADNDRGPVRALLLMVQPEDIAVLKKMKQIARISHNSPKATV